MTVGGDDYDEMVGRLKDQFAGGNLPTLADGGFVGIVIPLKVISTAFRVERAMCN